MTCIGNYEHQLSFKYLDSIIDAMPEELIKNEDAKILVSGEIYNNIKFYLINERYKGFLIYTINNAPKDKIYASGSKYHN